MRLSVEAEGGRALGMRGGVRMTGVGGVGWLGEGERTSCTYQPEETFIPSAGDVLAGTWILP